ncbi:MAG: hypothetical protein H7257_09075 [Taibaiella sp.]|nr:hypothetical protein [Taibaiella sp.]
MKIITSKPSDSHLLCSIFYACCLLFISFMVSCNKPVVAPLQLPPETHTGADILAFKANGKIYISKGAGGKLSQFNAGVSYGVYDSNAIIIASSRDASPFYMDISSKFSHSLGTFKIEPTPFSQGATFDTFKTNNIYSGSITYTYYDGNILAGTFAFDAVSANDSVVHITEGRFDIQNH